jgi:hypothetical protein
MYGYVRDGMTTLSPGNVGIGRLQIAGVGQRCGPVRIPGTVMKSGSVGHWSGKVDFPGPSVTNIGPLNQGCGRKAGSMNLPSEIFSLPSRFGRHSAPHSDTQGACEFRSERCRDLQQAVMAAEATDRKRGADDVTREPFELLGFWGGERLSGKNRKPGMDPTETSFHETLRQAFLLMQTAEEKTAKQFANSRRIERSEFEELRFASPDSIRNDGVAMRIEVGRKCAESLNGEHTTGSNILRSNRAWKDRRTAS